MMMANFFREKIVHRLCSHSILSNSSDRNQPYVHLQGLPFGLINVFRANDVFLRTALHYCAYYQKKEVHWRPEWKVHCVDSQSTYQSQILGTKWFLFCQNILIFKLVKNAATEIFSNGNWLKSKNYTKKNLN